VLTYPMLIAFEVMYVYVQIRVATSLENNLKVVDTGRHTGVCLDRVSHTVCPMGVWSGRVSPAP